MNIFKRKKVEEVIKQEVAQPQQVVRRFVAANSSRFSSALPFASRINAELKRDYIALVSRARDAAKNNDFISGILNNFSRNVIGSKGFMLQCNFLQDDYFTSDTIANNIIENLWYEYQRSINGYVTTDCKMGGRDFDELVLRTFITDGEVFIQKIIDETSKFGVRYKIIDSLDVDYMYNVATTENGGKIIMGVELDASGKVIAYHVRDNKNDNYSTGKRYVLRADEVIHIFKRNFADQVRGYTMLAPLIFKLEQLESFAESELIAARVQACSMAFYEDSGTSDANEEFGSSSQNVAQEEEVYTEMAPGQIAFAPKGKTIKQIQNNHPASNFGSFCKAILRGLSNSIGMSYNKATADYESTNYSSLREAQLEDRESFKSLQEFLIENWKEIQYREFLKYVLLNNLSFLPFEKMKKFYNIKFNGKNFAWIDPVKEITALKIKLDNNLIDPISVIEEQGLDVDDVLNRTKLFQDKLKEKGIIPSASLNEVIAKVVEEQVVASSKVDDTQ